MSKSLPDLSGSSLLAVFAHPDDESLAAGGLLARCSASGARVSLLCLTKGEHGPGSGAEGLGDVRANELQAAARVLGIHDLVLLSHQDGMLPWISEALLEADISDAIRRFQPDVVVTFDEDGLYWHPDHIAVHERTTSAVAHLGDTGPALLYATMPAGAMRAVVESASSQAECGDGPLRPVLGVADVDAFGSLAPGPTLVIEAGRFGATKLVALRCHRSQVEDSALDCLDEDDAARLLATEHYRRAGISSHAPCFVERLGTLVTTPS
jgi:LmbE family N-acetylglucosaminyl deacetylase